LIVAGILGRHIKPLSARPAMARHFSQALHEHIPDAAGQGRHNIPPPAARASHLPRLGVDVLVDLQIGSLAKPHELVDSPGAEC